MELLEKLTKARDHLTMRLCDNPAADMDFLGEISGGKITEENGLDNVKAMLNFAQNLLTVEEKPKRKRVTRKAAPKAAATDGVKPAKRGRRKKKDVETAPETN